MSVNSSATDRWFAWRTLFAIGIVAVLVVLGVENIALRARYHEVEDGVLWANRAEGVTAVEVLPGSAGDTGGVRRGDVVVGVDSTPIRTSADIVELSPAVTG